MKPDKNIFRLKHIIESIGKIEFITRDLSFEMFDEDWVPQDVVVRNLEIIGEASNHVSNEIKDNYPEVFCDEMRGLRNVIAHIYFDINTQQIWDSVKDDLPVLKAKIEKIIQELDQKII